MRAALLPVGRDRSGFPLTPRGITVHSTAVVGATARNIRQSFEGTAVLASAHLVADWKETLVMVPCWPGSCEVAYHAGKTANRRFLALEICEAPDEQKFQQTWTRAAKIIRLIFQIWEWPLTVDYIWSHQRVGREWGETDHQDPLPYFARWARTWEGFLVDVVQS